MPLARCIQRCWDSQTSKRYFPGDVEDFPEDHIFITGGKHKNICFQIVKPEDLVKNQNDAQIQLRKAFEMIAALTKKIEDMGQKVELPKDFPVPEISNLTVEPFPEGEKRGPGRPKKV